MHSTQAIDPIALKACRSAEAVIRAILSALFQFPTMTQFFIHFHILHFSFRNDGKKTYRASLRFQSV